ncbi:hypothetical protein [Estrella lausannensis]|uniref:Uncharacterized protein n=1 Tax=Estrella lausannensis TaxID=483423 RepID=A0A0H5DPD8_9BACT|nr:hypothetical protein [Estrella lausannensis]CRX37833.1 hypothetical protein ELAC_0478 [Estrella lausannensis]
MTTGDLDPDHVAFKIQQLDSILVELLNTRRGSEGPRLFLKIEAEESRLSMTHDTAEASRIADVARLIHRAIRSAVRENVDQSLIEGLREHFRSWKREQQEVKFRESVEVIFAERREIAILVDERDYGKIQGKSATFHKREMERLLFTDAPKFSALGEIIESDKLCQAFDFLFGLHFGKTTHSGSRGELLDGAAKKLVSEVFSNVVAELKEECDTEVKSVDEALRRFESVFLDKLALINNKRELLAPEEFKFLAKGLLISSASSDAPEIDSTTGNFEAIAQLVRQERWREGKKEVRFATLDVTREKKAKEVIRKIISHPLVQTDLRAFFTRGILNREEGFAMKRGNQRGERDDTPFAAREFAHPIQEAPIDTERVATDAKLASKIQGADPAPSIQMETETHFLDSSHEVTTAAIDHGSAEKRKLALVEDFDRRFALLFGTTKHSITRGEILDASSKKLMSLAFESVVTELMEERKGIYRDDPQFWDGIAQKVLKKLLEMNKKKLLVDPAGFERVSKGLSRSLSSNDAPEIDHSTGTFGELFRSFKSGKWTNGEKVLLYSTMDFKRLKRAIFAINQILSDPEFKRFFLLNLGWK